jgi:hypothetical protein
MSVQAGTLPVNQQQLFTQQHAPMQTPFAAQTPYQQSTFAQSPYAQMLYGQQQPYALTPYSQQPYAQSPHNQAMIAQSQIGQQILAAAPIVSEVTLRVVTAALATIVDQIRIDQQALQSLWAQGQLTPQAHANVLVESARRCAPVVAGALAAVVPGLGQQIAASTQQYNHQSQINPQLGWNPQFGLNSHVGVTQQHGWQTPFGQQFGQVPQSPFGYIG